MAGAARIDAPDREADLLKHLVYGLDPGPVPSQNGAPQAPLTSEPPLGAAAPLTSESPLAAEPPLTSETGGPVGTGAEAADI
ncbi:hypothetical protein [Streptomyces sp. NPDC049879]|uniref:hypothetical protein n=1 Tax=Streptomyces sp. NPDC049879 TaxID=3365598 RepID=UPI0037AF5B68